MTGQCLLQLSTAMQERANIFIDAGATPAYGGLLTAPAWPPLPCSANMCAFTFVVCLVTFVVFLFLIAARVSGGTELPHLAEAPF